MSNISLMRLSNLFWLFFNTLKQLRRSSRILPACVYCHSVCALTRSCFYVHQRVRTDGHGCIRHKQESDWSHLKLYTTHFFINELRLRFACRELLGNLAARNTGWTIVWSFTLRSFNCVFTILADSWSGLV